MSQQPEYRQSEIVCVVWTDSPRSTVTIEKGTLPNFDGPSDWYLGFYGFSKRPAVAWLHKEASVSHHQYDISIIVRSGDISKKPRDERGCINLWRVHKSLRESLTNSWKHILLEKFEQGLIKDSEIAAQLRKTENNAIIEWLPGNEKFLGDLIDLRDDVFGEAESIIYPAVPTIETSSLSGPPTFVMAFKKEVVIETISRTVGNIKIKFG